MQSYFLSRGRISKYRMEIFFNDFFSILTAPHRAGDTSTDINWYSKRISLAAVMAATDVFMLQDNSPDFQDTWSFLDRRLEDLALLPTISKIPNDALAVADGLFQTLKILAGVKR